MLAHLLVDASGHKGLGGKREAFTISSSLKKKKKKKIYIYIYIYIYVCISVPKNCVQGIIILF